MEGEIERREEREALLLSLSVWEAARGRRREGDGDRAMGVRRRRRRTKGEMGSVSWRLGFWLRWAAGMGRLGVGRPSWAGWGSLSSLSLISF